MAFHHSPKVGLQADLALLDELCRQESCSFFGGAIGREDCEQLLELHQRLYGI